MSKKIHLISLGCSKNLVDSEVMLGRLKTYEIDDDITNADIILINTCGFIQSAKEESIQTILQAHKSRKRNSLLVVSGCLTQRYKEELKELLPEIDIITGVGDFDKIDKIISEKTSQISENVFLANENTQRVITGSKIHAYIKISEGCNQNCSFCAIPSFKGRLNSRSIDSVLKELKELYSQGFRDFTFIAQDSSSYLRDKSIKYGLIELIDAIDKQNLPITARILYLYPSTTTLELIYKIRDSKIFQNYFDMPIQHISEKMLNKMKRGVSKQKHIELLNAMREVENSFVRSTIIIGHPGEDEKDFNELCEFVEDFGFDRLNIFAFSPEEGTLAYCMEEKLSQKIINKRISIINKIIMKHQKELYKKMLTETFLVLLEGKSEMSEYFYKTRDIRWAPEVDGEILINDSELEDLVLKSGYYKARVSEVKDNLIFATITDRI